MIKNRKQILLLLLILGGAYTACQAQSPITGLWVVQGVMIGDEERTPNARWMRFHADFTQQSGNGWLQHSVGTWTLDPATQDLSITNTTGLLDPMRPQHRYLGDANL